MAGDQARRTAKLTRTASTAWPARPTGRWHRCLRTNRSGSLPGRAGKRGSATPECQTPAIPSNRHRRRLDIRANLGSNGCGDTGRVR